MKKEIKKISLTEFNGIQMSVESLSKLKGGCASYGGTSYTRGGNTTCTGSDHDNKDGDSD